MKKVLFALRVLIALSTFVMVCALTYQTYKFNQRLDQIKDVQDDILHTERTISAQQQTIARQHDLISGLWDQLDALTHSHTSIK